MTSPTTLEKPIMTAVAEPITETIAVHLAANCSSGMLEAVRERAQAEFNAKRTEEASFREQSIDPRLTVEQARGKRDEAEDAAHEARRIAAAIEALDARLPTLKAAEHRERIMPAYEKYRDERAAFIKRLRERWPKLTSEMLELIQTIERYRHEPGVEIPDGEDPLRGDVELEARGLPSFHLPTGPVASIASTRLPNFENDPWKQYLWTEQMRGLKSW